MWAIAKQEFWQLTKNIKSIIVILALVGASYYFAKNGEIFIELFSSDGADTKDVYAAGLLLIITFLGPIFVMALSHDVLNRETSSRTIRFLLTRTSHTRILIGKYIGVLGFWLACALLSLLIIVIFSHTFSWITFVTVMALLIVEIAFAFLLSTLIPRPRMTMFLGIVLGIFFPIFAFAAETTDSWWRVLKYVSPMHYTENANWEMIALPFGAALLLIVSLVAFKRGEY